MASSDRHVPASEVRLREIQAVTDAALAHMGTEELLDELLDRVRELLDADTAAVLLLDSPSGQLVATAARGLEDEVRQGTRVPLGGGFAGRVAVERRPVIIENVERVNVLNPILLQKGVRSLLGVPLIAGGTLLGVLHTGTLTPRRFTDDDAELLRMVADRVALAVQVLLSRSERVAARELQRSLLPSSLPVVPGVEMAARYSPGEASVGGDWYDVFTLPSGELCVAMGDVAGHGLRAAAVMGRMRSVLRACALETADPAEALTRLDRHMHHFEPEALATVLYAVCHPSLEWVRISSAGHFPPVLAFPNRPPALLDMTPDVLIGLHGSVPRNAVTMKVPKGSVLCLYTDGLVERRDSEITVGLDRLCDAVFQGRPEAVCAVVMAALVGHEPVDDDVALLTLRRSPD